MTTIINQVVPDNDQEINITVLDNERGPAGKDGAIQYQAGSGIKITDDNVISVFGQAGGSADWGTIGGDIDDQTDLVAALNLIEEECNSITDTKLTAYTKTSNLATVARTNQYYDLSGRPVISTFTVTSVDPGEGANLSANSFIAVYEA